MKSRKLSLFITTVFLLCAALSAFAQNTKEQNLAPNEDVILQWNRVLGQTLQIPNAQPPNILSVRSLAMCTWRCSTRLIQLTAVTRLI